MFTIRQAGEIENARGQIETMRVHGVSFGRYYSEAKRLAMEIIGIRDKKAMSESDEIAVYNLIKIILD